MSGSGRSEPYAKREGYEPLAGDAFVDSAIAQPIADGEESNKFVVFPGAACS
jgi:hypothetical protein